MSAAIYHPLLISRASPPVYHCCCNSTLTGPLRSQISLHNSLVYCYDPCWGAPWYWIFTCTLHFRCCDPRQTFNCGPHTVQIWNTNITTDLQITPQTSISLTATVEGGACFHRQPFPRTPHRTQTLTGQQKLIYFHANPRLSGPRWFFRLLHVSFFEFKSWYQSHYLSIRSFQYF